MTTSTTSADFFEGMFASSADPWNFASDSYEQSRYRHIVRALGPGPYRHALEPGCSVGVLTEQLATICERVEACDISPTAVATAQCRCSSLPSVTVRLASLPEIASCAGYDLVVLSEIGYYFHHREWSELMRRLVDTMEPGTILLASHWLGRSPDHVLSGDEVHGTIEHSRLRHELGERHTDATHAGFRLDRWCKLP